MKNLLYRKFEEYRIIKKGHFLLSDGGHAENYINKDKICTIPALYSEVIQHLFNTLIPELDNFDIITGPAVAGVVYASPVAFCCHKMFVYPEKKIVHDKTVMKFRDIFHNTIKGKSVVIIEDIVTTGASIRKVINAIEELGGIVYGVVSIFDRSDDVLMDMESVNLCLKFSKSLIHEYIPSWPANLCPLCSLNEIQLTDPKTNVII